MPNTYDDYHGIHRRLAQCWAQWKLLQTTSPGDIDAIRFLDRMGKTVEELRSEIAASRGSVMKNIVEGGTLQSDLAAQLGISAAAVSRAIAGRARTPAQIYAEALMILGDHIGDSPVLVNAVLTAQRLVDSTRQGDRLAVARRVLQAVKGIGAAVDLHGEDRSTVMLAASLAARSLATHGRSDQEAGYQPWSYTQVPDDPEPGLIETGIDGEGGRR